MFKGQGLGSLPGIVPPGVLGWLLLSRSGLGASARAGVLAATANSLDIRRVAEALKAQYPDAELMQAERGQGHRGHRAYLAGDPDDGTYDRGEEEHEHQDGGEEEGDEEGAALGEEVWLLSLITI